MNGKGVSECSRTESPHSHWSVISSLSLSDIVHFNRSGSGSRLSPHGMTKKPKH
uniref:Uncharacterized protein n=1 Tax=Anguilla anguilla TaxID=7936 RepID=A0A0E9QBV3_ANGAN